MVNQQKIKIFSIKQGFPCGPESSCCGPVGQSEQEVMALKSAIEKLGLEVEVYDLQETKNLQDNPQVFELFSAVGPRSAPVIILGDEVISMGESESDIVSAIKCKL